MANNFFLAWIHNWCAGTKLFNALVAIFLLKGPRAQQQSLERYGERSFFDFCEFLEARMFLQSAHPCNRFVEKKGVTGLMCALSIEKNFAFATATLLSRCGLHAAAFAA